MDTDQAMPPAGGMAFPRSRVRFDPTINLGHVLTACAFLAAAATAWRDLDARVSAVAVTVSTNAREIVRVENQGREATGKLEVDFGRRIVEQRNYMNETQVRTGEDVREIKTMMRDGFREFGERLDRKADKPGR